MRILGLEHECLLFTAGISNSFSQQETARKLEILRDGTKISPFSIIHHLRLSSKMYEDWRQRRKQMQMGTCFAP